eukprot:scaffold190022_cov35-Tisochrysis_lutea.AAC.1
MAGILQHKVDEGAQLNLFGDRAGEERGACGLPRVEPQDRVHTPDEKFVLQVGHCASYHFPR